MKTVLVVGAGAAGLMAAISAADRGSRVLVVESTIDGGRKILISGGGRCNVLPNALEPDRFVSDAPRPLVRRFLRSWPLDHQRAFFEQDLNLPLKLEDDSGKYFPVSNRARDVRDGLVALAGRRGVEFQFDTRVTNLARQDDRWIATTSRGAIDADAVILATGGRSVPATGSDGAGLDLVKRLGHTVRPTYPALTPLICDPPRHASLSGISLTVRLRARGVKPGSDLGQTGVSPGPALGQPRASPGPDLDQTSMRDRETYGGFLFTHHGYSGPAVLDISDVAVRSRMAGGERATIRVRWCELDAAQWSAALQSSTGLVVNAVSRHLPSRLAEHLIAEAGIPADRRASELRREERTTLVDRLTTYELPWTGDEGYKKAEVTGGGVALEEVDHRTMESRVVPRLFLCGEILDAFGPIGGHNFAWAWATGRLAGLSATS